MTMATDDSRLSNLEGRIAEQSASIQDLREGQRQTNVEMAAGFREVNGRIDQVNARIERLFLAMLSVGAMLIGLQITQIIVLLVRG
ncbi:MAG: hypothetical protein OXN21_05025 [Chloroflexota bacterium]|nr:hypothetical protein [Chloroflexota bacterium]